MSKTISSVVMQILQKNPCSHHQKPYEYYSPSTHEILCFQCRGQNTMSINDIIDNPILAMEGISIFTSSQTLEAIKKYKSWQKVQKALEAMLTDLENKITNYCSNIRHSFNDRWEKAFNSNLKQWQFLQKMENSYSQSFQSILAQNFVKGTKQELEEVLTIFTSQNENPNQALKRVLANIKTNITQLPYVNWQYLSNLYETVTDPLIWRTQSIIGEYGSSQRQQKQITLLPNFDNILSDGIHRLKFNDNSITLSSQDGRAALQNQNNDSLTELSAYRLLGVSYDGIKVYKYAYQNLEKVSEYQMKGCTHHLVHDNCIIILANGRLIRLWLRDGKQQVLGFNYKGIERYGEGKFMTVDTSNNKEIRSFEHNIY